MNDHPNAPDQGEDHDRETGEIIPAGVNMPSRKTRQELMTFDDAGAAAVERNELRQAMEIAREYPRSIEIWQSRSRALVLSSLDAADEAIYALPPRKNEKGVEKVIEGPSIRFAEAISYAWGNYRVATRIAHEGQDFVTCTGVFFDLETNALTSAEVPRSIIGKYGRFKPDMIRLTASAGMSIALRNAVLRAIPKALWWPIYLSARAMVAGDFKHLQQRTESALRQLQKMGADEAKVLAALNLEKTSQIEPEHIVILRGMATAIRDKEATVDDLFPDAVPAMFGAPKRDLGAKLRNGKESSDAASGNDGRDERSVAGDAAQSGGGTKEEAPARRRRSSKQADQQPAAATEAPPAADAGDQASTTAAAADAVVAAVGEAQADALSLDENNLISEFQTAMMDATTPLELTAALSDFEAAIRLARPLVVQMLKTAENKRREELAASATRRL